MSSVRKLVVVVMLATLVVTGVAFAEEKKEEGPKVAGYASLDWMTNYVWRGQKLSNSWVLQPSVGVSYGPFGANIWANYDSDSKVDEGDSHGEITETDITLTYTRTIDKWTLGLGYIYYAFSGANDTQEIYFTVSYDILLTPTLTVYWDYDEGQGVFAILGLSHTFDLGKGLGLKLGGTASYNFNNMIMGFDSDGKDFSNFYNAELSAALTIPITKNLSITPKVAYSFPLSSDAKEAIKKISDDGDKDVFYGGVNLTLSF